MSESDVLARAAKALRDAHTGERAASGFTRARIMNTQHRERRRRIVRWAVFSPLVSLLLVGSAWAQNTGKWPAVWRTVASVFSAAPEAGPGSRSPERRPSAAPAGEAVSRPAAPAPAELAAPVEPAPLEPPSAPEAELTPARPAPRVRRSRAPRSEPRQRPVEVEPTAEAAATPVVAPASARELALFRAAHDLHFRGDRARDAIAAYDAYLREYPRGRFVPEARYNGALDRIKLGERAAAREALAPFAVGEYGGYRQREARELLEALR